MMGSPLAGKICLVTGATRGIGKGIALQLGQAGAIVYITGRTLSPAAGSSVGGSLEETANEVTLRGGQCIPVQCDHSKDDEVQALFDRVKKEQDGQLDVLINNAYAAAPFISENLKNKFWEQPLEGWDIVNNVGLRNHYLCAVHAARMMVPRKNGLIVNISSPGGLKYLFNVAYGVGKAACDRMAADCAHELRRHNVAFVSLWPGAVRTEYMINISHAMNKTKQDMFFLYGETPEYSGKCIVKLCTDPNIMKKSGHIIFTGDIGAEFGLTDENDKPPANIRQFNFLLNSAGYARLAAWTPNFFKIPKFMYAFIGSKY